LELNPNSFEQLTSTIRGWLREIGYLPKISNGVWDKQSVLKVQEFYGALPTEVPTKKRKLEGTRSKTISNFRHLVLSNFDSILFQYQQTYYAKARLFWLTEFPNIDFPLEKNPTSNAMKALILFIMTHVELQLQRPSKADLPTHEKDCNFYPFYTLPNAKHFEKTSYFSKFVVFVMVNRANKLGFAADFLATNKLPGRYSYTHYSYSTGKLKKQITDNTKLTTALYDHIIPSNFGQFYHALYQLEGSAEYYQSLFKTPMQFHT
jgi:hypothetical protein